MSAEALSYSSIRSANQAREADELRTDSRKKNLLILVLHYLNEEGYVESANSLSRETNLDMRRFEVCDNVDLETVLMEYESYYYIKFSKYPKITKKLVAASAEERGSKFGNKPARLKSSAQAKHRGAGMPSHTPESSRTDLKAGGTPALPKIPSQKPPSPNGTHARPKSGVRRQNGPIAKKDPKQTEPVTNGRVSPNACFPGDALALQGLQVHGSQSTTDVTQESPQKPRTKAGHIIDIRSMINDATRLNVEEGTSGDASDRMLKPLGGYVGYTSEWRDLAQTISREIYSQNPNVKWDDIIGLDNAKRLVKEAVVYPIKYPQLFSGILSPWKGLLLYGPPGTGKTLLAKAVATECNTTFFNISASSIVSKWRGDSEKLVRVLFELARFHAPSTIFLDELESLMSQRGSTSGAGEHEGSRRMKTELLVQMDGLSKTDDLVFLLAASNLPWELDHAMLRRLEKRILVDLPTAEARQAMFKHHLPPLISHDGGLDLRSDLDYEYLSSVTHGYSGSDIKLVCKEAAMRPVRKIFDALESHSEGEQLHFRLDTITTMDVEAALKSTKPSAKHLQGKFSAWQKEFESV